MKRLLIIAVAALSMAACAGIRDLRSNLQTDDQPYDNPFYAKYLNTGSTVDAQISQTLAALRQNPDSPDLHNALGALLLDKGFPKDAEREFERAVNTNRKYYPAWYNLGLVRAAGGDELGARRAFTRTVSLKPGHAPALFQLGLVEEKRQHNDRAVDLYAKAYAINPALLRVDVNPRILDSKLTHIALIRMYSTEHSRRSMQFQGVPSTATPTQPTATPAASPQPAPQNIVTPAAPATQIGSEPSPVHAPSSAVAAPRRGGRLRTPVEPRPAPAAPPATPPATPPPATPPPANPPSNQ
jgi:tetratricopeptide (TPR) repeat protein